MTDTLQEFEQRLDKRREVDMIVKMRVDQLQRESVFVSPSHLEAVLRVAEKALAKAEVLEKRVASLEAQLASLNK